MNEDFFKLKKMSGTSVKKFYNHIRGWKDKGGNKHQGLIEKQHPELWKTPPKYLSFSYIYKVLFNLKLSSTELKVALAIIGHTWNFDKTSEIISRDQFINGKYDTSTEQCLVGPAGISSSSFAKSIDSLVQKGIIRRIIIAHTSGPKPLYSPNPVLGGEFIYESNPQERNWSNSNYPEFVQEAIDLIQAPLTWKDSKEGTIKYELIDSLIKNLRHIELLPLSILFFEDDFKSFANFRQDCQSYLNKEIQKSNPKEELSFQKFTGSSISDIAHAFEDHANYSEGQWIESDEAQNHIAYLTYIRTQVDSPLPHTLDEGDAGMQVKLIYLRWGDILLTISIDAWDRFEDLITKYGATFDSFGKSIIDKYHIMKTEREKIPWVKKSADTYYKTKKKPAPNADNPSTPKILIEEITNFPANVIEMNQDI